MSNKVITIERFIIEEERSHPGPRGIFQGCCAN